jgi:hypothetical protein
MKNLVPYKEDCFDVHSNAVNKKQRGDLKDRLLKLNSSIEAEYKVFLAKFSSNDLLSLVPNATLRLSKDDLSTLYNYQSSVIISVRKNIQSLQVKTIISTCQNCTIDSANTLDHILPQSAYPEFVVNPKNLFPCCSACNSFKEAGWGGTKQEFLNLYLDDLPKEQYLFVDVSFDKNSDLDFSFYLRNVDGKIDATLFSTIESHYNKLQLFSRMKLKSVEYVSELETKIRAFKELLTIQVITNNLIKAIDEDKAAYGDNHWKCVLELALLKNPLFLKRIK